MAFKSIQADETMDTNELLKAYYQQLTPFEQHTCDIAREHLGSSFDLARSNGFIRWSSTRKT